MSDKSSLRAEARERRKIAHANVDAGPALERLAAEIAKTVGPVSFYRPIRTEIDPTPVMEALAGERSLCLPVTNGRDAALTFRAWWPGTPMVTDGFGVAVPAGDNRVVPEVLVVPMLAFDDALHRLGYGAGHYDRTLAALRPDGPVTTIGFAYEAQHMERLPTFPTDQALDVIVTEARVRRA